jgi:hypothetical protein
MGNRLRHLPQALIYLRQHAEALGQRYEDLQRALERGDYDLSTGFDLGIFTAGIEFEAIRIESEERGRGER